MPPSDGPPLEALLATLADERFEVRCQALDTLGERGEAARPALSRILSSLEDTSWQVRSAAARALAALGGRDVSVGRALLSRALHDSHLWVRHAALGGLGAQAFPTADFQAPLLEALTGAHPAVHRLRALQALSRLRLFSEPTLHALVRAVKDTDWEVRAGAVRALGESRQGVPHVMQAINAALSDADPVVRETACEALMKLSPLRHEDLAALAQTASDTEPQVRIACAKALGQLPAETRGQALQALLRDADERVREAAVLALGNGGQDHAPLSLWTEFLEDPSATVRQAAESFLADIAHAGADIEPLLADTLVHRSQRARTSVVHVLARTGVRGTSTLDPLSGALLDLKEQAARDVAAHLVARDEPTGLPYLLEGLRHRQVRIRHRAARALGFFHLDSATAASGVPLLGEALRDPSERVRRAATESLWRVGLPALPTYPGLIRRLFEQTELVPLRARKALQGLKTALPADWVFPEEPKAERAERLFVRWISHPAQLSLEHQEELRRLCLARERWHLQLSRAPLPTKDTAPSSLLDAASRAAEAAVTHGARSRRHARPGDEARDREREFAWLLGKLHALVLAELMRGRAPQT